MTNEEIEKKVRAFVDDYIIADGILTHEQEKEAARDTLSHLVRSLVSQAYEEAAQAAEGYPLKEWEDQYRDDIAARIRALKEPLMLGPVASTSR